MTFYSFYYIIMIGDGMQGITNFIEAHTNYLLIGVGILLILVFIFYNRFSKENDPMSIPFRIIFLIAGLFILVMTLVF